MEKADHLLSSDLEFFSGGFLGGWRDRFVVLTQTDLTVYENSSQKRVVRVVNLPTIGTINMGRLEFDREHVFSLLTTEGDFIFAAKSIADREKWSKMILEAKNMGRREGSHSSFYSRFLMAEESREDEDKSYFDRLFAGLKQAKTVSTLCDSLILMASYLSRTYKPELMTGSSVKRLDDIVKLCTCVQEEAEQSMANAKKGRRSSAQVEELYAAAAALPSPPPFSFNELSYVMYNVVRFAYAHKLKLGIENEYTMRAVLGKGSFATVFEAEHKETKVRYAIKAINKARMTDRAKTNLMQEVDILSQLSHPNILAFHDFYEAPTVYYVVMELANGFSLFDQTVARTRNTEAQTLDMMRTIVAAVHYIHENHVAHRDLKLENILFNSHGVLKIADFGFAAFEESGSLRTFCGSKSYMAPEVISGVPYDYKVDCWSLGVILYVLLAGSYPFDEQNEMAMYRQICAAHYSLKDPLWDTISAEAKDLIGHLLQVDPVKRYSTEEILAHPWFGMADKLAHETDVSLFKSVMNPHRKHVLKGEQLSRRGKFTNHWKPCFCYLSSDNFGYTHDMSTRTVKRLFPLSSLLSVLGTQVPEELVVTFKTSTGEKTLLLKCTDESNRIDWKETLLNARRCWYLIARASEANSDGRIGDALTILDECRRSEGMFYNYQVIDLLRYLGWRCELDHCAMIWQMQKRAVNEATVASYTTASIGSVDYEVAGMVDGHIAVFNAQNGSRRVLKAHKGPVTALAVQMAISLLVSVGEDGCTVFWDLNALKQTKRLKSNTELISLGVSSCEAIACGGTKKGELLVWDTQNLKEVQRTRLTRLPVTAICVTSRFVICSSNWNELLVLDVKTMAKLSMLQEHKGAVHAIACCSKSRVFFSAGEDSRILMWNLETLALEKDLRPSKEESSLMHCAAVISMALTNDGKWLLSLDSESKCIMWRIERRAPEVVCSLSPGVRSVVFSADCSRFLAVSPSSIETWVVDWVLTYEGKKYCPPVKLLSSVEESDLVDGMSVKGPVHDFQA